MCNLKRHTLMVYDISNDLSSWPINIAIKNNPGEQIHCEEKKKKSK